MVKNKIELFVPPDTIPCALELDRLNELTGKRYQYAAKGRYALYHILVAQCNASRSVLLPAYFCHSVLEPLHLLNADYHFYDIDLQDLNPSVASIRKKLQSMPKGSCVIVPSFYGNAAALDEIEEVCADFHAKLIDDAAQSFGATLNGRMVGTFGDAGMTAFSPGKATAGHMGSLFWCENDLVEIRRTRHRAYHWFCYQDYRWNRVNVYGETSKTKALMAKTAYRLVHKQMVVSDRMEPFEEKLLGGYLWQSLKLQKRRAEIRNAFIAQYGMSKSFRIVSSVRGETHPCKIVLVFPSKQECECMKRFLDKKSIRWFGGYDLLPGDASDLLNTRQIINHIVELPIELDEGRRAYLNQAVEEFCG